jgi:hypothetical protein
MWLSFSDSQSYGIDINQTTAPDIYIHYTLKHRYFGS